MTGDGHHARKRVPVRFWLRIVGRTLGVVVRIIMIWLDMNN
ncbi:hypothetical protein P0L94_08200 [Microbacter sp. GSS18]|nr:hypothetical protein P0L94_08200 [Microbacter sp. GSS18]